MQVGSVGREEDGVDGVTEATQPKPRASLHVQTIPHKDDGRTGSLENPGVVHPSGFIWL